ncbi:SDR family NAD(P)-dependent oxidoreductase [uncultured Amnibacterium sp.]|uniref:SDR family NAD(P)-dependent oxidoreductase n=1 Tax=uncultured Amnibacterium sp. TaxID=1631851 RepID=UPI0035CC52ED
MARLAGRTALITGVGGGMGRAASLRFAAEGARIVGCDMDAATAEETARLVRDAGGEIAVTAPVDLGDAAAAAAWVEAGIGEAGDADILYNNASSPRFGAMDELSVEDWDHTMRNELDLVFYVSKAFWPHLKRRGGGVILNVGSIAGIRGVEFMAQNAHGAAKGGVLSLTQQLAAEGGRFGIRCVAVSPGFTVTPQTAWLVETGPQAFRDNIARIPLQRVGQPDDIVNAALFLASDEASWITGVNLVVDGGQSVLG